MTCDPRQHDLWHLEPFPVLDTTPVAEQEHGQTLVSCGFGVVLQ